MSNHPSRDIAPEDTFQSSWTDVYIFDQLRRCITNACQTFPSGDDMPRVLDFCHDMVVKRSVGHFLDPSLKFFPESAALEFIHKHTSIPVSEVCRLMVYHTRPRENSFLLTEKIEGETLETVWPTLPSERRLETVHTVRGYVEELQRVSHAHTSVPGPIGTVPRKCLRQARLFGPDNGRGPFSSSKELKEYFNTIILPPGDHLNDSYPLVLCHDRRRYG